MEFGTFVNFLVRTCPPKSYELAVDWWYVYWPGTSGSLCSCDWSRGCNGRSAADAGLPGGRRGRHSCRLFKTGIRKSPSAAAANPERKPVTVANHRVIRRSAIVMVVRSRSAPRDAAPATANVNQPTLV